jgi:hypothetical protein
MKEIGKFDEDTWIYGLTEEEVWRLHRREGTRKNVAQRTASIRTILAEIEKVFGLPQGSVRFCKPDGRTMYNRNTKVKRILDDYEN